jgi:hypothetical protein
VGDAVQLVAQVDDTTAQAALAALIGGDGIQEEYVQDRRISYAEAVARGEATLALRGSTAVAVNYTVKDTNARSGAPAAVNLPAPTNVVGTFTIQRMTMSDFQPALMPTRRVTASTMRFSLNDLLRRIKEAA